MRGRRRPRTLRTRLVVASVALIAVVCTVIGTVTTLALRSHLYEQLDDSLREAAARVSGGPAPTDPLHEGAGNSDGDGDGHKSDGTSGADANGSDGNGSDGNGGNGSNGNDDDLALFVTRGPQPNGTLAARVETGLITEARVGAESADDTDVTGMTAKPLTAAQLTALGEVARDGADHTVTLPGLGDYRVRYAEGDKGAYHVGIPTVDADTTVTTLVLVEVSVTAAGLLAAGIAGWVLVSVATRPLRKVAATATRVAELPLHSGEVNLSERVPEAETDPHTEVGRVGAALNRMLDHVHGALHARQESETRVRQFVADASHELRTPLASIRGYAELTRRGRERVGPDTRHALGRIESEAGRMTLLVEDLLLLARLDAGRPLRFGPADVVPLVVDTVSDARAAGPDHVWRLRLPDDGVPVAVSADPERLHQVLVNLLANARTHTPPGTTVTARVERRGPWVCVDVHDDGPGIPPELLPYVFERFARGDSARARVSGSTGSTGLGLAIVRAVATAHGGEVTVESRPGRTVFTVHLPAAAPSAPAPESPAGSASPPAAPAPASLSTPATPTTLATPTAPAIPCPASGADPGETSRQQHPQPHHSATTRVRQGV
ncbi:ATP-binding protein [Streptomyces sp. NPDC058461]|uniref:HAMP domain-containing sensor histidine kinase n=1 Tax=Streptomyces sp. NPDC058461 TaxID=3346509 RepID=UPI00364C89B8